MRKTKSILFLVLVLASHSVVALANPWSDRITVTVQGQGPDVVLIPGLACSGAVWDTTAAHLQRHYRIHIVQINGFANLPARANARGPILNPVVKALDAYIKTNRLKSSPFIGHSIGGTLAMMLAIQHPEDISRLMIVSTLPFDGVLVGAKDSYCNTTSRGDGG